MFMLQLKKLLQVEWKEKGMGIITIQPYHPEE